MSLPLSSTSSSNPSLYLTPQPPSLTLLYTSLLHLHLSVPPSPSLLYTLLLHLLLHPFSIPNSSTFSSNLYTSLLRLLLQLSIPHSSTSFYTSLLHLVLQLFSLPHSSTAPSLIHTSLLHQEGARKGGGVGTGNDGRHPYTPRVQGQAHWHLQIHTVPPYSTPTHHYNCAPGYHVPVHHDTHTTHYLCNTSTSIHKCTCMLA